MVFSIAQVWTVLESPTMNNLFSHAPVVQEIPVNFLQLPCDILQVLCYCVWHAYLPLRHNATPVKDLQMGTACPNFWCIPIGSDKLRRTLKRRCFVANPEAKLGR